MGLSEFKLRPQKVTNGYQNWFATYNWLKLFKKTYFRGNKINFTILVVRRPFYKQLLKRTKL